MLREKLRNKKGFTLIEIIVVIVILAVLMAVAVPSVMSYMNEGNKAKYETVARAALINTQTAVAKDYGDDGKINDVASVVAWVDADEKRADTLDEYFGSAKSYGSGVKVITTSITLNKGADDSDDVSSAVYRITLGGNKYRTVTVEVNGKMTVGAESSAAGTATSTYKYTTTPSTTTSPSGK